MYADNNADSWWVYILKCQGGVFYTGITNNMTRRFRTHLTGNGAKFTRAHKPIEIWCQFGPFSRREALQEEHRIKSLSHKAKEGLRQSCP